MIGAQKNMNSNGKTKSGLLQRLKKAEGKAKGVAQLINRKKKKKDSNKDPRRKKNSEWWSSDEGSTDTTPAEAVHSNKNAEVEEGEEIPLEQVEKVLCSLTRAATPPEDEFEVLLDDAFKEEATLEPGAEVSRVIQVRHEKQLNELPSTALPESRSPKPASAIAATGTVGHVDVVAASQEQPTEQKEQQQFRILVLASTANEDKTKKTLSLAQQQRALKSSEEIATFAKSLRAACIPFEVLDANCSDKDERRRSRVDELLQISGRPSDSCPQFFLLQPSRPTTFLGDWDALARGDLVLGPPSMTSAPSEASVPPSTNSTGVAVDANGTTIADTAVSDDSRIWSSSLKDHVTSDPGEPAVLDVSVHSGCGDSEEVATNQTSTNDSTEGQKPTAAIADSTEGEEAEEGGAADASPPPTSIFDPSSDDMARLLVTAPARKEMRQSQNKKTCEDCRCVVL